MFFLTEKKGDPIWWNVINHKKDVLIQNPQSYNLIKKY